MESDSFSDWCRYYREPSWNIATMNIRFQVRPIRSNLFEIDLRLQEELRDWKNEQYKT